MGLLTDWLGTPGQNDFQDSYLGRFFMNPITQMGMGLLTTPAMPGGGLNLSGIQSGYQNYLKLHQQQRAEQQALVAEQQRQHALQWMHKNAPGMADAPAAVVTPWANANFGPEAAKLQAQQAAQEAQNKWMAEHGMGDMVGAPEAMQQRTYNAQHPMPTNEFLNYSTANADPGFGTYQQGLRHAGATQLIMGGPEKMFDRTMGDITAKAFNDQRKQALQDVQDLKDLKYSRGLLDQPNYAGTGSNWQTSFGAALKKMGFNQAEDAVANTQAYAMTMARQSQALLPPGPASDKDVEIARFASGADTNVDPKALKMILDRRIELLNARISAYQKTARRVEQSPHWQQMPISLAIPGFDTSPQGGAVPPGAQPAGAVDPSAMTNDQQGASFDAQIQGVPTPQANAQAMGQPPGGPPPVAPAAPPGPGLIPQMMTGQVPPAPVQAKPSAPVSSAQAGQEIKAYYQALLQKGVPEGQALEMAKAAAARRGYQ